MPPPGKSSTRSIHVYSNAPHIRLELNGKVVGTQDIPFFGMASFGNVTYAAGTLTAFAVDASGTDVANHTIESTGDVAAIVLSLDAPVTFL